MGQQNKNKSGNVDYEYGIEQGRNLWCVCKFAEVEEIHLWICKNSHFYIASWISFVLQNLQVEKIVSTLAYPPKNILVRQFTHIICLHTYAKPWLSTSLDKEY